MLNCSPQSSLPVPWPFWELRGCTAGDITLFKERAGVARSAQIIPAVKQNLIKVESFFFSLRLCHGVFLQSENYKLRTKRTHCCGKQCKLVPTCNFWIRFLKIKFKMLVGLCPNPLRSASDGCRLRIFEKCFLIWVPMPVVSALFAQMDFRKQKIVLCSTSGIVLYLIYINLFVLKSWRCSWQHEPFVFPYPAIPIAENSRWHSHG